VELVDKYEWDEKEMLNIIIIEMDPENDNTCSSLNANQIIRTESPRNTQGVGVWPGQLGSETRWVTTRTACQWLAGSLDGSGYDPGKAYLQLPDDLAVKVADVVGYPLATAVVEHDIGCGSARAFFVGDATDHMSNSSTCRSFCDITSSSTDLLDRPTMHSGNRQMRCPSG